MTSPKTADGSPRAFMQARRPEQFSDSPLSAKELRLSRSQLEYHLETLTNRQQESAFEEFARSLAEREICPNLRPMTGPVGGGDSKVDASSYPIASSLADRVYWGIARPEPENRWVFAFSTKKAWPGKVRKDARSAATTTPKPHRIYFITSQFTRDKTRDEIQSALFAELGIPVEILDRNWITSRMLAHEHWDLLVKHLQLDIEPSTHPLGQKDAARRADLDDILRRLNRPEGPDLSDSELADTYLQAAIIARELELPEAKTDAYLKHAKHLAEKGGHLGLRFQVLHHYGWTMLFWYENYAAALQCLHELEQLISLTDDAADLDLAYQLFVSLKTALRESKQEHLENDALKSMEWLTSALQRVAENLDRPGNALYAEAMQHSLRLLQIKHPLEMEAPLRELVATMEKGARFAMFPLPTYVRALLELGEGLARYTFFDDLYERIERLDSQHENIRTQALRSYNRGIQLWKAERLRTAIASLGQATSGLMHRESRHIGMRAALAAGSVCEELGLFWAARAQYLFVLHAVIAELKTNPQPASLSVPALQAIASIELRHGRVPAFLAAVELGNALAHTVAETPAEDDDAPEERRVTLDAILAMHLLRLDLGLLEVASRAIPAMSRLGFPLACQAIQFALGHVDDDESAQADSADEPSEDEEDDEAFFRRLMEQSAITEIAACAILGRSGDKVRYYGTLPGAQVAVEFLLSATASAVAEDILAVVEAFLSTVTWKDMLPTREVAEIRLDAVYENDEGSFVSVSLSSAELQWLTVKFVDDYERLPSRLGDEEYTHALLSIVGWVMSTMAPTIDTVQETLLERIGSESGFARATQILPCASTVKELFGPSKPYILKDWMSTEPLRIRRIVEWDSGIRRPSILDRGIATTAGEPARRFVGPINISLWDSTHWSSTVYMYSPESEEPPVLIFVFENAKVGEQIFLEWKHRIAAGDVALKYLRVVFLYERINGRVGGYIICVAVDLDRLLQETAPEFPAGLEIAASYRQHESHCTNPEAFESFGRDYARKGVVILAAGGTDSHGRLFAVRGTEIEFRGLEIRDANEARADATRPVDQRWAEKWLARRGAKTSPPKKSSGERAPSDEAAKQPWLTLPPTPETRHR